jgi:hypothetical protein
MEMREVLEPYCKLMGEIQQRVRAMFLLVQPQTGLPDFCIEESQQLQIRMISETLALACLIVHRDIDGAHSAKLAKAYQADRIMNALGELHPKFYPRPIRQLFDKSGKVIGIDDIKDGFLTKDELLKSYRNAAGFLHVGNLNELLAGQSATSDPKAIGAWVRKLTTLLSCHTIFLADKPGAWDGEEPVKFDDGEPAPRFQVTIQMDTGPKGGEIQAHVFQTIRLP